MNFFKLKLLSLIILGSASSLHANDLPKGVGPVKEIKLEEFKIDLAKKGKAVFETKCSSCHKIDERHVGPALKEVLNRRAPEWVLNMMLNPAEMTEKDETAQKLLEEFMVQMPFQNITQDDAKLVLEYLRKPSEVDKAENIPKNVAKKNKK